MNDAVTIIRSLGGTTKVARALSVETNVVGNWSHRNLIPWHRHGALLDMARDIGVELTRSDLERIAPRPGRKKPTKRRAA